VAAQWTGTGWLEIDGPNPAARLVGVSCVSPTTCIAVGSYGDFKSKQTLVEQSS
jgi:hypothetical protein